MADEFFITTDAELEALQELLAREPYRPKVLSIPELRRWMDADEGFAAYVREKHPSMAAAADALR